jgi:hypothetical protein
MSHSIAFAVILTLVVTVAVLVAVGAAVVVGFLAKQNGATLSASVLRAGVAFGGTFALALALLTFVLNALVYL